MYSLDVNFLKDRGVQPESNINKPRPTPKGAMTPLYIGVGVGLFFPAVVLGLLFFLQQQTAQLQKEQTALDNELGRLQLEKNKIAKLKDQINQVNDDTQSLASVFEQIKPWSAILQDIRERTPPNVQIITIQQTQEAPVAPQAAPAAKGAPNSKAPRSPKAAPNAKAANEPSSIMKLEISGRARSFDDVNYFLLELQRSSLFKNDETQLIKAELVTNPDKLEVNTPRNPVQGSSKVTYGLPKDVAYQIKTTVSDASASDLLRELDRKGAVGLVTRIKTLQQIQQIQDKGVNQP